VITQDKIANLQIDVVKLETQRQEAVDSYVYAMISSGRKPALDSAPTDAIVQGYINLVGTTTMDDTSLFKKGTEIAKDRGDFICPQQ